MEIRNAAQHSRAIEIFERPDFLRNQAQHHGHAFDAVKDIDPKSSQARSANGKVQLPIVLKSSLLLFIHDGIRHPLGVFRAQSGLIQSPHLAFNSQGWHLSSSEMEIAGSTLVLNDCES